jgi:hypothetical protein
LLTIFGSVTANIGEKFDLNASSIIFQSKSHQYTEEKEYIHKHAMP